MHPTDYLTDYILDELTPQEAREVEAHLATCETCRTEVRALRETFVNLVETVPPVTPPPTAWSDIQARLNTEVSETDLSSPKPRRTWQVFALAASLFIALGGLFWGFQERQNYQQAQQEQRKVAGWLSRPDVTAQQLTDMSGERLGSVLTLSDGRALFILRDAPPTGSSYQAWGYANESPVALGLTNRTLLEVLYTDYEILEVSLEPKQGSSKPTRPLGRVPVTEAEKHNYDN